MMRISSTFSASPLLSPRTADYVSALIREGDKFDYCRWLQGVREEEAQAKRTQQTSTFGKIVAKEIDFSIASRQACPSSTRLVRHVAISKGISRLNQDCAETNSAARIRRRLAKIRDAWEDFQANRNRDAVYGYLEAVFAIVTHYKVRRKTRKLLRHAFGFAHLSFDKNADPFSAVIRCTSGNTVDAKMVSKWARALRYAAHSKVHSTRLRRFMKEAGGVNACASLYARRCKRGNRRSPRDRN